MNKRSQAVRLPRDFLSPLPVDGSSYLDGGPLASDEFMQGVEDLPVQERQP